MALSRLLLLRSSAAEGTPRRPAGPEAEEAEEAEEEELFSREAFREVQVEADMSTAAAGTEAQACRDAPELALEPAGAREGERRAPEAALACLPPVCRPEGACMLQSPSSSSSSSLSSSSSH